MEHIEYCVLDGFNFMMDMYERQMKEGYDGWKHYGEFIKNFMDNIVGTSSKKWIIIAHNFKELMNSGDYRYYVPIKGSTAKLGLESLFNIVVYTRKIPLLQAREMIESGKVDPELFHISEDEEIEGVKYTYQVRSTQETVEGRIRSISGLWNAKQIFIDNNAQLLLNHIEEHYKKKEAEFNQTN